ncbi:MAG: rhomboid family intramembrane serine protease [Flavobacteriales bacterium]|nr:rhomboid family intramembrane serine protease [Flavobacteriales bacterium]
MDVKEQVAREPSPSVRERKLITSAIAPALVVLGMWIVYLLDRTFELDLYRFGTYPRTIRGLAGILTSPFIHGDAEHLLNNSIPMLVLGSALLYFFPRVAGRVVLVSWLVSGVWVWISARSSFHIGASGVVYGLAAFLFTSGLIRKQRVLMGLSMLVVFLYGSFLWGIFPIVPRVSWESHFWGAAAGVLMAYFYRHIPAAVQDPKPITWDEDDEDEVNAPPQLEGDNATSDASTQLKAGQWHSTDTWNIPTPTNENPANKDSGGAS